MAYTAELTQLKHTLAVEAAYNATIPKTPSVQPPYASASDYLQKSVQRMVESWRESLAPDRISVAEFILRAPSLFEVIAQSNDENVVALLNRLKQSSHVWLASDEVIQGIGYLLAKKLITKAQHDNILRIDA